MAGPFQARVTFHLQSSLYSKADDTLYMRAPHYGIYITFFTLNSSRIGLSISRRVSVFGHP